MCYFYFLKSVTSGHRYPAPTTGPPWNPKAHLLQGTCFQTCWSVRWDCQDWLVSTMAELPCILSWWQGGQKSCFGWDFYNLIRPWHFRGNHRHDLYFLGVQGNATIWFLHRKWSKACTTPVSLPSPFFPFEGGLLGRRAWHLQAE